MIAPRVRCAVLATDGAGVLPDADGAETRGVDLVIASAGVEPAAIQQRFREAKLIVARRPGWAAAANTALDEALASGADYLLFVEPGAVLTPDLASALVQRIESDPRLAAIGVKNVLRDDPTTMWGRYGRITWGPGLIAIDGHRQPIVPEPPLREVDWVLANGCMLRLAHARRIGAFDERLYSGFAEADWCVRARQAGFAVAYAGGCELRRQPPVERFGAARFLSSPSYLVGRSTLVFARKHAGGRAWVKLVTCMGAGVVLRLMWYVVEGTEDALRIQWPFVSGMYDGFRRRLRKEKVVIRRDTGTLRFRFQRFVDWIGA